MKLLREKPSLAKLDPDLAQLGGTHGRKSKETLLMIQLVVQTS